MATSTAAAPARWVHFRVETVAAACSTSWANVWEWTTDEHRRDRVFVGGAWDDKSRKKIVRDSRNWASPGSHFDDLGFRCVRQLPAPPQQ